VTQRPLFIAALAYKSLLKTQCAFYVGARQVSV